MKQLLLLAAVILSTGIASAQWQPASPNGYMYYNGSIGIGTSGQPVSTLDVYGAITGDVYNTPAFVSKSNLGFVIEQGNIGNDFVSSASYYSIFAHNTYFNGSQWIRRNQYSNTWATVMNHNFYDIQVGLSDGTQPSNQAIPTSTVLRILPSGNVLINETSQVNSGYKLDVNGNVRATEVVVNTTGADYVFDANYKLPSLQSLNTYIQAYHHLPGMQSAGEMQKEGVDIGSNQTLLLEKIEQLTLYILKQNKKIEAQQKRIERLERINQQNSKK